MTPLRFRAWHPVRQKMYDVRSLHNLHSGVNLHADLCRRVDETETKAIFSTHYSLDPAQNEVIYMQSTGLKDKNGAEIFEGDILRMTPTEKTKDFGGGTDPYVTDLSFSDGAFVVWLHDHNGTYSWEPLCQARDWYDVEVIGDIHQDPELLSPSA